MLFKRKSLTSSNSRKTKLFTKIYNLAFLTPKDNYPPVKLRVSQKDKSVMTKDKINILLQLHQFKSTRTLKELLFLKLLLKFIKNMVGLGSIPVQKVQLLETDFLMEFILFFTKSVKLILDFNLALYWILLNAQLSQEQAPHLPLIRFGCCRQNKHNKREVSYKKENN